MATHASILAWTTPWTEGPGGSRKDLDTTERLTLSPLTKWNHLAGCLFLSWEEQKKKDPPKDKPFYKLSPLGLSLSHPLSNQASSLNLASFLRG